MSKNNFLEKFYRGLIYVLPAVLFFSYYPLIHFGASESMNFEISLPIIWLVLFDVVALLLMIKQKLLFKNLKKKWVWLLFPGFLTISVLWSLNSLRGLLTVGILWLVYFAIDAMSSLKGKFSEMGFKEKFWEAFIGSTLLICVWCLVQCVLDLVGVSREYSLMCEGCTYASFGFPHPSGLAIEPQFMGNLLLAPTIATAWLYIKDRCDVKKSLKILLLVIFAGTLFLTFSRGAIYAFDVAMIFMTMFVIVKEKKKEVSKRVGITWLAIIFAFLLTLNLQGIMAALSPTNDTYFGGVSKALNHLSLGVIDIRKEDGIVEEDEEVEEVEEVESEFDGYVAASTDVRLELTDAAIKVWAKDFKTMMFGVGLGGAGQALYVNGFTAAPREIIQNQYVSLLLETGLVGLALLAMSLVLLVKAIIKVKNNLMVFTLVVAYGVSLCFFAGLANALHIYLLPIVFMLL